MSLTQVNAANMITGVLPAANGGTGQATALIPSGTVMMFGQTAAPTGFTKLTANDNAALRVVSGSASTGGSVNFTTAFASQAVAGTVGTSGSTTATNTSYTPAGSVGTSGSTTLSTAQMPTHNHSGSDSGHSHSWSGDGGAFNRGYSALGGEACLAGTYSTNTGFASISIGNAGSSNSHNHTGGSFSGTPATITQNSHTHTGGTFTGTAINLAVKYVDVIMATKD